jgi:hypothetical protein
MDLGPLSQTGSTQIEASIAALGESDGGASADPGTRRAMAELKAGQSGINAAISEFNRDLGAVRCRDRRAIELSRRSKARHTGSAAG